MGTHIISLLVPAGGGGGSLPPKIILVPSDFPTNLEADTNVGRLYIAGNNVTDNDPTKTNTGQSALSGEEFVWDGVSSYVFLGPNALWLDDGTNLKPLNLRDLDLQSKNIKNVTQLTSAAGLMSINTMTISTAGALTLGAGGVAVNEFSTVINALSTDLQSPTSKAVWDAIQIENIWKRLLTTISPENLGDDLDMGTGDITTTGNIDAATGHFTGKLTVDGLLDPTGVLVSPQTTPPATDNGTHYYDSTTNKFLFRENGVWVGLGDSSIWEKIGSEISLDVLTDTISPTVPLHYTTHPTFLGSTDLIDKEYADSLLGLIGTVDVLSVTIADQTIFTLSTTPTNTVTMGVHVDGVFYDYGFGFTVSGTTLTWLRPLGIALKTTDRVVARYDFDLAASPFTQFWQRISGIPGNLTPVNIDDNVDMKDGKIIFGDGTAATQVVIEHNTNSTLKTSLDFSSSVGSDINTDGIILSVREPSRAAGYQIESLDSYVSQILSTRSNTEDVKDVLGYLSIGSIAVGTRKAWSRKYDSSSSDYYIQSINDSVITERFILDFDTGIPTFPSLNTLNGIVQTDAAGVFSSSTIIDAAVPLEYTSHPTFTPGSFQFADVKYVDDHTGNAIWKLLTNEVTLTTPTNTIGAAVPLKYTSHPTFTPGSFQFADVKYVDDKAGSVVAKQEVLSITSPGQTAFTLSQTPSGLDSLGIFLNGIKQPTSTYSFVGTALTWSGIALKTTDLFEAWYDWQAPSIGFLEQKQIFYVADAGSDGNDGKSIEKPFRTPTAAAIAVNALLPSFTNQFVIKMIGGMRWTGDVSIPTHTTLWGQSETTIVGDITLGAYSDVNGVRIEGTIIKNSGSHSRVKTSFLSAPTNKKWIEQTGGILYVDCPYWEHNGTEVGIDKSGSSVLYITADRMHSTASNSTIEISGGTCYINAKYVSKLNAIGAAIKTSGGAKLFGSVGLIDANSIYTALDFSGSSDIKLSTKSINGGIIDDGTNTVSLERGSEDPYSIIRPTSQISNLTGDSTLVDIVFNTVDENISSLYNTATGVFTADINGYYSCSISTVLNGIDSTHTSSFIGLSIPLGTIKLESKNLYDIKSSGPGETTLSGFTRVKLNAGDPVKFQLFVGDGSGGGNKTIDIISGSILSIKLDRSF